MAHPSPPSPGPRADVVVPVYGDVPLTRICIEAVLAHSGSSLGRLILVDDCGPDSQMLPMLRSFRAADERVLLLENARNQGFVGTANRGLSICEGHAVILNSDTRVTAGWLAEMLSILESSERIAAVSPLSNNATLCSVPDFGESASEEVLGDRAPDLASLPRWTELPTGNGFCLLMRDTARETVGLFDPAFGSGYNEENDWCQRVRQLGLLVVRANRAFVFHRGEASFAGARAVLDLRNAQRLVSRHPSYLAENRTFADGPEAHLAATAVRSRLGRLRIALHPGLRDTPGLEALDALLAATGAFESVNWLESRVGPVREDVLLAPLTHSTKDSARRALAGTGRLVSVLDAWRPVAHDWRRGLFWAQLKASDVVWVPSENAAAWLRETAPEVATHVVSWPHDATAPAEASVRETTHRVLLMAPTTAIRGLAAEAVARLGPGFALQELPTERSARQQAMRGASVLLDFGGTPAGVLAEAWALGLAVRFGGLSVADALPSPLAQRIESVSPTGLLRGLERPSTSAHVVRPPSSDVVAQAWSLLLSSQAAAPAGRIAEARAAVQSLLSLA